MRYYLLMSSCLIILLSVSVGCSNTNPPSTNGIVEQPATAGGGLHIPAIVLPESSVNMDMIGLIVYNGHVYTQTDTTMDAVSAKAVLGTKLGTTKGNIDEWSKQDEYAVEFASTIGEADVYSVRGYDQSFRIMTYYESDGVVYTEFYECLNGITVSNGEDFFGKLNMAGNMVSAQYRTYSDWNNSVDQYLKIDDIHVIDSFVEQLNHTVPYTRGIAEEKLGDFRNNEQYRELVLHLKDGSNISLVIIKDGHIRYGHSNVYFKMESEVFKQVWNNESTVENENAVPLDFQPVHNEQQIQIIDSIDETNIIKKHVVVGGSIVIHSNNDDMEHIYGVYQADDGVLYDLGIVGGMSPQLDDELVSIEELVLFDRAIVRLDGVFGANALIHNYYSIDDGKISPFLRIDTGHAKELDLDGDSTIEIVSSHGTPMLMYIYKWEDGKFSITNVNESLNALSVILDEDHRFNIQLEMGSTPTKLYEYKAGVMWASYSLQFSFTVSITL